MGPVFDAIAVEVEARVRGRPQIRHAEAGSDARRRTVRDPAAATALIAIPGAIGELIDKITILEIKESRVDDALKLRNIRFELALLRKLKGEGGFGGLEARSDGG